MELQIRYLEDGREKQLAFDELEIIDVLRGTDIKDGRLKYQDVLEFISGVIFVYADQEAAELIAEVFENLPVKRNGECVWRGEMAVFIAENLIQ